MKRWEIALTGLTDAAALACGMMAIVSAVPTAFGLDFSLPLLTAFCVCGALLLSFWMNVPKYGFGFGALFLAAVILIVTFLSRQIEDGAILFFCTLRDMLPGELTRLFDFDALVLRTQAIIDPAAGMTSFLMILASVFGLPLAPTMIRTRLPFLPVMFVLPTLLVSLLYTDQQPALWVLLLATLFCGYALIGVGLRYGHFPHRGVFSVGVLSVLSVLMLTILVAAPKSRFEPIPEEERRSFFADRFGEIADTALRWFGRSNPKEYDLKAQGDRDADDTEAFRVRSTRAGTYLLRTHSYGAYENGRFSEADAYDGEWRSMEALGKRQQSAVSILSISQSFSNERLVPYAFLAGGVKTEEARVRANGATAYSWTYKQDYSVTPDSISQEERDYYAYAKQTYTMRDGAERDALLSIAESAGIRSTGDVLTTARNAAAFVRNAGTYTLTPGKTPSGRDFVLYFLTESRQGYCVHFASATTAILQAMGIPARYTVGYYTEIPDNGDEWITVTEQSAHAWTEVYVPGAGWVPIESTPGFETDRSGSGGTGSQPGTQAAGTPKPTSVPKTPDPTPRSSASPTEKPTLAPIKPDFSAAPNATEAPLGNAPQSGAATGAEKDGAGRHGARWLLIPLVPLAWVGIGLFARRRREASFCRDPKRAIPDMAHYLKRLERFGVPKDPDAEDWALEAVFSDHKMKAQQKELLRRVQKAQRTVYANAPVRRFLLRWVLYLI